MIDRRTLLRWIAAAPAVPLIASCASDDQDTRYPHGIASGDPTPDGILLWTRVEGAATATYELATDEAFRDIVATGSLDVSDEADRTVRVVVTGLAPATRYWYRFHAGGITSPTGRTKTAPLPDADVPVRIALASCQDFGARWFHAWRAVDDDVDFVLFVGDYIYETIGHLATELPPDRTLAIPDGMTLDDPIKGVTTAVSLADYRALYRQYRRDPDLRAVHARVPFVMMWDDHEFANDAWGNHATDFDDLHGDEASPERYAAATRAWFEYSPIRPRTDGAPVYRSVRWGRHVEIVLLDERTYRDDGVIPEGPIDMEVGHVLMNSAFGARTFVVKDAFDAREAAAPPSMVGAEQRAWAIAAITTSTASWKVLASPLVVAQMVLDLTAYDQLPEMFRKRFYFKTDQWDGYRTERRAILQACAGVDDLVVLSGDLHGFYAAAVYPDYDAPMAPVAVEYAVSAISAATVDVQLAAVVASSPLLDGLGLGELVPEFDTNLLATNPHIVHAASTRNGLAIVGFGPEAVDVQFVRVADVTSPTGDAVDTVAFRTPRGIKRIDPV